MFVPIMNTKPGTGRAYFTWKYAGATHFGDLLNVDQFDIDSVPAKKDCTLLRYETDTSKICGYAPLIMFNLEKKLVYFWDEGKDTWETAGTKIEIWPELWSARN